MARAGRSGVRGPVLRAWPPCPCTIRKLAADELSADRRGPRPPWRRDPHPRRALNLDHAALRDVLRCGARTSTSGVRALHPWPRCRPAGRGYHLGNLIGNPTEDAIAAASLIFGGVLDRLPGTAHLPRARWRRLPISGRPVGPGLAGPPRGHGAPPRCPSTYLRRLSFDSLTHWRRPLRFPHRVGRRGAGDARHRLPVRHGRAGPGGADRRVGPSAMRRSSGIASRCSAGGNAAANVAGSPRQDRTTRVDGTTEKIVNFADSSSRLRAPSRRCTKRGAGSSTRWPAWSAAVSAPPDQVGRRSPQTVTTRRGIGRGHPQRFQPRSWPRSRTRSPCATSTTTTPTSRRWAVADIPVT